jgi:hypothetical protein
MAEMSKTDVRKTLDAYQCDKGRFRILDVPDLTYLMIDGAGAPGSAAFAEAIETLYPVAYTLKFASKRTLGRDYVVPPLEGRWWADDMDTFTNARDKSRWSWTLMILVPEWVGEDMYEGAVAKVAIEKSPVRLRDVRFERLSEGRCVQIMHLGSFDDEGPVLATMHHEFIPGHGLRMTGLHHQIYLSDFRKVAPDKLRTILRQPVADL